MRPVDVRMLGALELAYIGDTVHDLFVRERLLRRGLPVGKMHRQAMALVCAAGQARLAEKLMPHFTEVEQDILRRGRNAHPRHAAPKRADPADYQLSTGLEALWGYLFLTGEIGRLNQLLEAGLSALEEENACRR